MTMYHVIAQAFNRRTGEVAGPARLEQISTVENVLFAGCDTILEVKAKYEAFWNHVNADSRDVVFVQKITRPSPSRKRS